MTNKFINFLTKLGIGTLLPEAITEHVESGSNWKKFPDGTLICNTTLTLSSRIYIFKDNDALQATWDYPVPFVNRPSISVIARNHRDRPIIMYETETNNRYRFRAFKANSDSWEEGDSVTVVVEATGRWK